MALLPGSPAIDAGVAVSGVTTDQRGLSRPQGSAPEIGAFESQGFNIAVTSGSGQSTGVNTTFSAPLVVTVAANNPIEPVAGGLVTFAPPPSGASATVIGSPATINATGTASITAAANGIGGSYTVWATTSASTTAASFSLTNNIVVAVPTFSALTSPTIVYGTSTTTLTGHLGSGTSYPTGSSVSITLNSVTQTATVDGSGNFTTTFSTASLGVAGGPYTVTYAFAGNSAFTSATDTSTTLTVEAAPLTVTASNQTQTYGFGGTSASLGTSLFGSSGLQNGETIGSVTLTTNATTSTSGQYNTDAHNSNHPWTLTPAAASGGTFTASNYSITYVNATIGLTVNAKALTVTGVSGTDKVYDGLTSDPITGTASLSGLVSGDVVNLSTAGATASFATASVGTAKAVTFAGYGVSGADASNYSLAQPAHSLANITVRSLHGDGEQPEQDVRASGDVWRRQHAIHQQRLAER